VDDLRVYLEHAGARVHAVADIPSAAQLASALGRPVLIHHAGRARATASELQHAFAGLVDVRHVVLAYGRRRYARMSAVDVVTLDGNCLRRRALVRAVAVAAGRASPEVLHDSGEDHDLDAPTSALTVAEAREQGRLILVAEDDLVNQKVILRQIELLGYAAEVAENGIEALRMWRGGHFALLLTDLHMPDMDGYTLAATIRREEGERQVAGESRMPILALTANALRGEAIRAQVAGMDEYLTKPLQFHLLKAAIRKWLPGDRVATQPGALEESGALPTVPPPEFDATVLRGLVGGDSEAVREVLAEFRASVERLLPELSSLDGTKDLRRLAGLAHQLKASARSVGAAALGDRCAELENACRIGGTAVIVQRLSEVEAALRTADALIGRYLASAG
jgi:CheY-like chemotaxis protein/HPt (histidine-containing phosphotransfer) domain-containing protein